MDHEEYKALLSGHALSTVDREEAIALEKHLGTCAECCLALDGWHATAGMLGYAAQPLEPSAQLRDRILAGIRKEAGSVDNVVPISRARELSKRRSLWFPEEFRAFQLTAAAVIFLGLVVGVFALWRQNRAELAEVARLSAQVSEAQRELYDKNQALDFFARPGMRMTELAGTKDAPSAHAMLAVDNSSGHAMLMARGLPQVPAGKAYQLWFIAGARPMPGKVFKPDASGNAMMDDQLPTDARSASAFAVTLEPQTGVPAPTGTMYLLTPTRSPS